MTRPAFGIGLSRLCGGADGLFESVPSGVAGFLAKPREPWKGVLSTCKFVSATRLCNVFASKSSRICRSKADSSSYVLFFESLSVLKCLPWENACLASEDACCFWRRKSGSRVLICRACASPGRWSCSNKLSSREACQVTPSARMICSNSCGGFQFRNGASNSSGRPCWSMK